MVSHSGAAPSPPERYPPRWKLGPPGEYVEIEPYQFLSPAEINTSLEKFQGIVVATDGAIKKTSGDQYSNGWLFDESGGQIDHQDIHIWEK